MNVNGLEINKKKWMLGRNAARQESEQNKKTRAKLDERKHIK